MENERVKINSGVGRQELLGFLCLGIFKPFIIILVSILVGVERNVSSVVVSGYFIMFLVLEFEICILITLGSNIYQFLLFGQSHPYALFVDLSWTFSILFDDTDAPLRWHVMNDLVELLYRPLILV